MAERIKSLGTIRDRIKEFRRVKASELRVNQRNWRTHPASQRAALEGVLTEIGYAAALLARELPDGSLELVDGHLRAETTPDQEVPVLVLDVDEVEADKILATFDPLGALAETDDSALERLLNGIDVGSTAIRSMLDEMADAAADFVLKNTNEIAQKKRADRTAVVSCLIATEDVGLLEEALRKTGEPNRGRALGIVCKAYLA